MITRTDTKHTVVVTATALILVFVLLSGCAGGSTPLTVPAQAPAPKIPRGKIRVTISAAGDVLPHLPIVEAAKQKDGSYDFSPLFKEVTAYLSAADITLANLETSIAPKSQGFSGYPRFQSPEEIIGALKGAGVDVLTTANNHSLDGGERGLLYTLDCLDRYGVAHTGTARTQKERDIPVIIKAKGLSVAVLSYTYGSNGLESLLSDTKRAYMVNYIDLWAAEADVKRARGAGADVVVLCIHWGNEYERTPDAYQEMVASRLFDMGVDVIFGSHPHVLQPMEMQKGLVVYSLGNFVSNQTDELQRYTDTGAIVTVDVEKDLDTGSIKVTGAKYTPTWVHRRVEMGRRVYSVVPIGSYMDKGLDKASTKRLHDAWDETLRLIGKEFEVVR